jgi:hypothetical protein
MEDSFVNFEDIDKKIDMLNLLAVVVRLARSKLEANVDRILHRLKVNKVCDRASSKYIWNNLETD